MKKLLFFSVLFILCPVALLQCVSSPAPKSGNMVSQGEVESSDSATAARSGNQEKMSFTVKGVTFTMILVKGGTFKMGATPDQGKDGKSDEKPVHEVTLSDYYIAETEVTQALYEAVMGENPVDSADMGPELPIVSIDAGDAEFFADKLSKLTGRQFRLPTEAEWEYAARGGNKSKGYKYAGSDNLSEVAWFDDINAGLRPVKGKAPNELGIYDMSGGVDEYCADDYVPYTKESQTNPIAESDQAEGQVVRGGSFCSSAGECRVSARGYTIGYVFRSMGFRLAMTVDQ